LAHVPELRTKLRAFKQTLIRNATTNDQFLAGDGGSSGARQTESKNLEWSEWDERRRR